MTGRRTASPGRSPQGGGEHGGRRRTFFRLTVCAIVVLLLAGCNPGNRLYRRGEYRQAAEAYAKALRGGDRSPELRYNLGTALLRLEAYDSARAHLEAAAAAGRGATRQRASYNGGNTDLVPVFLQRAPPEQRRPMLERAVAAYKRALLLDPTDADAKWNLELALRLLEEPSPQSGGAGGGGGEEESGGGGEGGQEEAPEPSPGGPGAMTQSQAERILSGAQAAEREVQGEKLRREQPRGRVLRDW